MIFTPIASCTKSTQVFNEQTGNNMRSVEKVWKASAPLVTLTTQNRNSYIDMKTESDRYNM